MRGLYNMLYESTETGGPPSVGWSDWRMICEQWIELRLWQWRLKDDLWTLNWISSMTLATEGWFMKNELNFFYDTGDWRMICEHWIDFFYDTGDWRMICEHWTEFLLWHWRLKDDLWTVNWISPMTLATEGWFVNSELERIRKEVVVA